MHCLHNALSTFSLKSFRTILDDFRSFWLPDVSRAEADALPLYVTEVRVLCTLKLPFRNFRAGSPGFPSCGTGAKKLRGGFAIEQLGGAECLRGRRSIQAATRPSTQSEHVISPSSNFHYSWFGVLFWYEYAPKLSKVPKLKVRILAQ